MDCVFLYRLETRLRGLCASWEAEIMGRQFAAHPSWLLNIPPDETVNIQEVRLRGRSALLIEDPGENGKGERATNGPRYRRTSVCGEQQDS